MRTIRNCSTCVVGGAGFLGSHLVDHLLEDRHCSVLVIDNLSAGRREFVHKDAVFHHHDITGSEDHLRGVLLKHKVRFVWNLTAEPYIPVSFKRPIHVCDVNFMGACKVINAAHEAEVEGIGQISSAEIYGEGALKTNGTPASIDDSLKIDEDGTVRPHSSYGVSKAAVDFFCQSAWRERKTPVLAVRQFNCIGERDDLHPYVGPEIYRQLKAQHGQSIPRVLLGNNSVRDFLYAGDAVKMMVEAVEYGSWGEVYNSGSEAAIKIYDLARLMGKLMGFAAVEVIPDQVRVRPWEIWALRACNDKLYSVIKYRPKVGLEESLRRMIAYFDARKEGWVW